MKPVRSALVLAKETNLLTPLTAVSSRSRPLSPVGNLSTLTTSRHESPKWPDSTSSAVSDHFSRIPHRAAFPPSSVYPDSQIADEFQLRQPPQMPSKEGVQSTLYGMLSVRDHLGTYEEYEALGDEGRETVSRALKALVLLYHDLSGPAPTASQDDGEARVSKWLDPLACQPVKEPADITSRRSQTVSDKPVHDPLSRIFQAHQRELTRQ